MKNIVELAIVDHNLRCEIKKYEIDASGSKIIIDKEHVDLNIAFDTDSYLSFKNPRYMFWKPYRPVYIAMKGATECINFKIPKISGPDPEAVKAAARNSILKNMGTDEVKVPTWAYVVILILLGIAAKVFGVL